MFLECVILHWMDVLQIDIIPTIYNRWTRLVSMACSYLCLMDHIIGKLLVVTMGVMELALVAATQSGGHFAIWFELIYISYIVVLNFLV